MKPVMYIFANKGLNMSPGKLAAQVAHAAVEAYQITEIYADAIIGPWNRSGYTKIVLEARDTEHMYNIEKYLTSKGFRLAPIVDEGRNEVLPQSFTAMGIEIVDRDDPDVNFVFMDFRTFKTDKPKKSRLDKFLKR